MFTTIPEYLTAIFEPLGKVLYAYALAGGSTCAEALALAFGVKGMSAADAWEVYVSETENLESASLASEKSGIFLPFRYLCETFRLNPFERFTLALALALELAPDFDRALASIGSRLTLPLALRLYASSAEEAIGWQAEWLKKEYALNLIFTSLSRGAELNVRPAARQFLLGSSTPPQGCSLFVSDNALPNPFANSDAPLEIARQLEHRPLGNIFALSGAKGSGRKYQISRYAQEYSESILFVPCGELGENNNEWLLDMGMFLALNGTLLCVCDVPENETPERLLRVLRELRPDNLFITCTDLSVTVPEGYSLVPIILPDLEYDERLEAWRTVCADGSPPSEELESLAARYALSAGQILEAYELARQTAARRNAPSVSPAMLHESCKRQIPHKLDSLAGHLNTGFRWDDLILPHPQKCLLRHICERVYHAATIYNGWGFGRKTGRGRGVRALFSGPPGTGKTMAAQIIAAELDMELYRLDLSSLVSKYIGETEKNLDQLFHEAFKSGGILFFDEADAIFGRRGEQKDSHDRYANMQTAFLLQRFEDYDGVVLLATNLVSNLDPAFMRRIHIRVDFSLPGENERRHIWDNVMNGVPFRDDVDVDFLSKSFELSGSAIKNILLTAAFLAAANGESIGMRELIRALAMEYAKTDKILSKPELAEHALFLNEE